MRTAANVSDAKSVQLLELLTCAQIDALSPIPQVNPVVSSIVDDSRRVTPGCLFVAIQGDRVDGHQFVQQAVADGAVAVVTEQAVAACTSAVVLRVSDSKAAASKLAAGFYGLRGTDRPNPALIGITGTNGKSTVAWLVRSILRAADRPTAMLGTIEYDLISERLVPTLTTPTSLELCRHLAAARDAGAQWAVLEVSSHALAQRRTDGLSFDAAVFTNLSGDHLDYHGTMEEYFAAKRRLFTELNESSAAILNLDDPTYDSLRQGLRAQVVTYSLHSTRADITAVVQDATLDGTSFALGIGGRSMPVSIRLVGAYNVQNALAAAAVAHALGVEDHAIRLGLEAIDGVPGRLQIVSPPAAPFTVVVDYAHCDDALLNVLLTLRPMTKGRLICVFGCGGDRDRQKRPRMAAVVQRVADVAYATSDNPRSEEPMAIIQDIITGFTPATSFRREIQPDRAQAIESAIGEARPGDTVLIAGKGHETYQLVADEVLEFDDVAVAHAALSRRMQTEDAA